IELGFEAAIPWTPTDTKYTWKSVSDGQLKYTDNGRPFDALNSAYTLTALHDALHPDALLSSFSAERTRLGAIARRFTVGTPLPPELFVVKITPAATATGP